MKNLFVLSFFLLSLSTFSQETYTMKSGGRVFNSKGERINSTQVAENFNQEALKYYKAGRSKKTVGNVLFWGGLISVGGKFLYEASAPIMDSNGNIRHSENTLFYIGGALVLISVPIKIGFQNKIRKSVAIMNDAAAKSDKAAIESTSLVINSNGLGVKFTF